MTSKQPSPRTPNHVNEVHFAFLDGAPDHIPLPRTPSYAERVHTSAHVQHLAGAGAPTSVRHLARILAFLTLLGIIPSTLIFLVDISVHKIVSAREQTLSSHSTLFIVIYIVSGCVLCLASTFVCHIWSQEAEGSGIPAMKSLMSGFYDKVKPALSMWALLAKAVGLVCAIGGGLPVGWEGPNVHISCIVAHHLSRLPPFRDLRKDRALRMQIMACACAVGLASSFGTPIGGVLYALETTASFYLVPTFWKCMLSTLAGSLVYDLLYKTPLVEAFDNTTFEASDYTREQLIAFIFLGVLLGVLGAFFVRCVHTVYYLRKRRLPGTNRYLLLLVVGLIAALVQYPLYLLRLDPRQAINNFFSSDNMESLSLIDVALLVLIKFPLIVVSIGLPIPAGVFIPCFLVGSGLGRLYGELLRFLFGTNIVPGGYAVVGAAAFTAGVTRALSVAVVIFEVTGQLKHMVPTLAAVVVSVIVANGINRSLYDTLIIMKQLPFMPHMRRDRSPTQKVSHIMRTDVVALRQVCTLGDIRGTLDTFTSFDSFPVVSDDGLLLGSVRRRSLLNLMNNRSKHESVAIPPDSSPSLQTSQTTTAGIEGGGPRNEASSGSDGSLNEAARKDSMIPSENETVTGSSVNRGDVQDNDFGAATPSVRVEADLADDSSGDQFMPGGSGLERDDGEEDSHESRLLVSNEETMDDYGKDTKTTLEPDLSPLVVTANTSLSQLHFMFVMLMPTHAYVLVGGVLRGIVTRGDIVQSGTALSRETLPANELVS